jgi:ADP-heptose:LPS heptosyltransferase
MRYLIINLTRLGDIIQSLALVRGLKANDPEAVIDFLAMSSFGKILTNVHEINETILLNDSVLIDNGKDDFWSGISEIFQKITYLNSNNYDLIINPIISIQSAYLTYLIKAHEKRGLLFTKNHEQTIKSDWSSFLLANQHNLGDHSFNLVDIFSGIANIKNHLSYYCLKASESADNEVSELFQSVIPPNKKIVGFHIGASQSNKSWEADSFKTVISQLVENPDYEVILFGGYKEIEVKDLFDDIKNPNFHNWIGKFELDHLISAISKVDLFVTNDTGPMHIAACTKRPIINLSLGPVSMWETAPYSENSLVVQANIDCHPCSFSYECPHWNCHKAIKPETILNLIHHHFNPANNSVIDQNVLIWKSISDHNGFLHWAPLYKRIITFKELFFELKRSIWHLDLSKHLSMNKSVLRPFFEFIPQYYILNSFETVQMIISYQNMTQKLENLNALLLEISHINLMNKNNLDKIKNLWQNVKCLKDEIFLQANNDSVLYDWFLFLNFQESQLESDDIKVLAAQTSLLYNDLIIKLKLIISGLNIIGGQEKI